MSKLSNFVTASRENKNKKTSFQRASELQSMPIRLAVFCVENGSPSGAPREDPSPLPPPHVSPHVWHCLICVKVQHGRERATAVDEVLLYFNLSQCAGLLEPRAGPTADDGVVAHRVAPNVGLGLQL